ncbi:ribbon-helix-helix protein [Sphingomonas sp. CCH5-D11]|jgi:hypothetical protein|uniref:ribbon-helix-helix protein n=1 Tax=Sphingomonas sp. CCH5-D11 TaxID=1768786 RepID=UPI00082A3505|nr:hypothetical protein [Sphingomonas sp. CCH5-D11]
MTAADRKPAFAARPASTPDAWVRSPDSAQATSAKADRFTARLTIDVTPELRGRIKVAAFGRGLTVADMLRTMLEDAFPDARDGRP